MGDPARPDAGLLPSGRGPPCALRGQGSLQSHPAAPTEVGVVSDGGVPESLLESSACGPRLSRAPRSASDLPHFLSSLPSSLLSPHLWHMEVPRLGVPSKLQLPAYSTATARWDPSRICDLHHSSGQRQILNPLSEARNQTHNLMGT